MFSSRSNFKPCRKATRETWDVKDLNVNVVGSEMFEWNKAELVQLWTSKVPPGAPPHRPCPPIKGQRPSVGREGRDPAWWRSTVPPLQTWACCGRSSCFFGSAVPTFVRAVWFPFYTPCVVCGGGVGQVPRCSQLVRLSRRRNEIKRLSWCLAPKVPRSDLCVWTCATALHTPTRNRVSYPFVSVEHTH